MPANECGGELGLATDWLKTALAVGRLLVMRRTCKRCGHQVVCSDRLTRCWQPRAS